MKKILKIILPILVLIGLFLPGYLKIVFGKNPNETLQEFTLNRAMVNHSGMSQFDLIDDWKKNMRGHFEYIEANDDGTVTVTVTETQRKYIIKQVEKGVKAQQKAIKKENPKYHIDINDDYTKMDFYYDEYLDRKNEDKSTAFILHTEAYCAYHQIFSGRENWVITGNVYNCNTGRFIASGNNKKDMYYDNAYWAASYYSDAKVYTLNEDLIQLSGYDNAEVSEFFKSTFSGYYLDVGPNVTGTVTMALRESQREYVLNYFSDKVEALKEEIKTVDSRYHIDVSPDYTEIKYYFDENMPKERAQKFLVEEEIYCAYCQIFSGNDDWSVALNLLNCDTEEEVASWKSPEYPDYSIVEFK